MVNYGNSPSSLGVLSARVPASLQATTANDSHAGALRARSRNRGAASHRGDAKACSVQPAVPSRDFLEMLPHEMSLRIGIEVDSAQVRHEPVSARRPAWRQTARSPRMMYVRPSPCRWVQGLSARRMTKLRSCSLSYFISHSLLRGPVLRVATGPRSALPEREERWRDWARICPDPKTVDGIRLMLS